MQDFNIRDVHKFKEETVDNTIYKRVISKAD